MFSGFNGSITRDALTAIDPSLTTSPPPPPPPPPPPKYKIPNLDFYGFRAGGVANPKTPEPEPDPKPDNEAPQATKRVYINNQRQGTPLRMRQSTLAEPKEFEGPNKLVMVGVAGGAVILAALYMNSQK